MENRRLSCSDCQKQGWTKVSALQQEFGMENPLEFFT